MKSYNKVHKIYPSTQYEHPPAPYKPGQKLKLGYKVYRVTASTHTHTQLEGMQYAIANWVLKHMLEPRGDVLGLLDD
jgi:hypothetical protein